MDLNERYIRQISLAGFGEKGQRKLQESKVLVIGAGGLGVPVLQYLTAMGVGTIGIVDGDIVGLSNLHRQVIYNPEDLGKKKVSCCIKYLKKQNPSINLEGFPVFLNPGNSFEIIRKFDLVVDATDNFSSRYLINDSCVILGKPFIYGAIQSYEGHVSVFNYQNGPTYRCLYPIAPSEGQIPDCNAAGVLGIVPGLVGSRQALEAVKVMTGIGKPLSGILEVSDFLNNSTYSIALKPKQKNLGITQLEANYSGIPCQVSKSISPEELEIWFLEKSKQFRILDVREAYEFEKEHLEGSISLPLSSILKETRYPGMEFPIVVVCQFGARSRKAINHLRVTAPNLEWINLEGGLENFKKQCSTRFFKKYDFS